MGWAVGAALHHTPLSGIPQSPSLGLGCFMGEGGDRVSPFPALLWDLPAKIIQNEQKWLEALRWEEGRVSGAGKRLGEAGGVVEVGVRRGRTAVRRRGLEGTLRGMEEGWRAEGDKCLSGEKYSWK